jgi:REP element-mobilizing transposase RayT
MPYDPDIHHRRSIRLRGYDYSLAGAYFVTIITHQRAHALGRIHDGVVTLSEAGRIVQSCWDDLPNHYAYVELDAFAIMPNHVHGIIVLTDEPEERAGLRPAHTTEGNATSHAPAAPVRAGLRPAHTDEAPTAAAQASLEPACTDAANAQPALARADPRPAQTDAAGVQPAPVRAGLRPAPALKRHGLPEIVRAFKSFSARRINVARQVRGAPFWHRNYYEHIIRNEDSLNRIRHYIATNPSRWADDKLYSDWSEEST